MVNSQSPVFLFIGDDHYSKEKAVEEISSSLMGGASKDLDYKIFYGGETNVDQILEYVSTIPFLASKRMAVVKEFDELSDQDRTRIVSYIKKPSKSTYLILESKNGSILDDDKDLASHLNIRRFGELKGSDLFVWVKNFASARGKKIDQDAIEVLKELQGGNPLLLAQELEKLVTYCGERTVIKAADVEELVGKSLIVSAFDLTAAIGEKNVGRAMKICSELMAAGKKHYEIVGLLCWHFKRILKAKTLQQRGQSDYSISGILRISKRYADEFFRQINSLKMADIRSKMTILLEADLDIKRTRFDPNLILEFAVIKLCLYR